MSKKTSGGLSVRGTFIYFFRDKKLGILLNDIFFTSRSKMSTIKQTRALLAFDPGMLKKVKRTYFFSFFKDFICLFLETRGGREKERERNTNVQERH